MLSPKSRPRYLPTLTHVVTEAELLQSASDMDAKPLIGLPSEPPANFQELVDVVMPKVVIRMRQEMQANLEIQLHQFETKMRLEVECMVRDAMNRCDDFPDQSIACRQS